MPTISYSRATVAQLRTFATVSKGLEIEASATSAQIRAKLAEAGFTGETIDVEDEVASRGKVLDADALEGRKTVVLNIQQQEGAGGKDAVLVGVNGKVARIKRGEDVRVPVEYVEVLRNAKKIVYERGPNNELAAATEVHAYPFSIVSI